MNATENKIYLGDGAYVEFTGYNFALTAENGEYATNFVYLEASAIKLLVEFARLKGVDV